MRPSSIRAKTLSVCLSLSLLMPVCLTADLRYEETTEIKGGIMESLGKFAGMFGAKGLEKTTTLTYFKGDRMRKDQVTGTEPTTSQIIQLDKEQLVSLDHKKKTYTVMTFAEIKAQQEKAIASARSAPEKPKGSKEPEKPDVKVEPKVHVKDTGETRVINGFNTRKVLLTVELEGEDQKTKDKSAMGADTELWLTKEISGFDEQNKFYARYAQKMVSPELIQSLGMSPGQRQDPRMAESMAAIQKEMKGLDGVAILTIMSFNISGTPSAETKAQSKSSAAKKEEREPERQPEGLGESIGKALGGFGGFGKKKKKEEPPPVQRSESARGSSNETVSATLMTSTTEMKNFSKGTLDAVLFDVPAGYKLKEK